MISLVKKYIKGFKREKNEKIKSVTLYLPFVHHPINRKTGRKKKYMKKTKKGTFVFEEGNVNH